MRVLLAVLFISMLVSQAEAQEFLSWHECVQEAARRNPELAAAQEAVRKAQVEYKGSYSPLLPQLSAASHLDQKDSSGGYSAELSVKQSLFSGFRNQAGVRQQRADLDAAQAVLVGAKAKVSFDLKSAFAQLIFAQEQARLAELIASRRQENVRLVELRFHGGRENRGSFLRSRALYLQADFEVAQAERGLRVAQRQLAKVLGRDQSGRIVAANAIEVIPPAEIPDLLTLVQATPAQLQAEAATRAAEAGVTIARSELLPDVSAVASLSRAGKSFPPRQSDWSGGIEITYPFWPGGQNFFDLEAARAEQERVRQNQRVTQNETVLSLENAFATFENAVQDVGIQTGFVEAAQTRAEVARSQYEIGLVSFQNWDQIESELINSQKVILSSMRDAVAAEAAWEKVQGKGVIP